MAFFSFLSPWRTAALKTQLENENSQPTLGELQNSWRDNLGNLYEDMDSADCSIQIGGETLRAHKFVLMAQSPVLKSCLGSPLTEEGKTGVIRITDEFGEELGAEAVKPMRAFLRYCYQGRLSPEFLVNTDEAEQVALLFMIADKYLVDKLREVVEESLVKSTTAGNVIARAMLAEVHSAKKLKEECVRVARLQRKTFFDTAEWMKLQSENQNLACELAVQVAKT